MMLRMLIKEAVKKVDPKAKVNVRYDSRVYTALWVDLGQRKIRVGLDNGTVYFSWGQGVVSPHHPANNSVKGSSILSFPLWPPDWVEREKKRTPAPICLAEQDAVERLGRAILGLEGPQVPH